MLFILPFLVALIGGTIVHMALGEAPPPRDGGWRVFIVIALLSIFSAATIVLVRLGRPTLSAVLLIGVWTFMTTLAALRGGVTTFLPALMIIPICAAGLLIDRIASVVLAALATGLTTVTALLELNGHMIPSSAPDPFISAEPLISLGFWAVLFWTIAALTSLLAGGAQRALQQSRARAEELARLSSQLETRVAEQTAELLAQAQAKAALEERARLAREIHDTLAQGLAGISVQLGAAQRAVRAMPDLPEHKPGAALATSLDLAHRMARETLAEARRSVWNLRNPSLEHGGLAAALERLTQQPLSQTLAITFFLQGDESALPPRVETELLRVAQEALANASKHAQATRAAMILRYGHDGVELTIEDNGIGFPEAVLSPEHRLTNSPWEGFGLVGMRERLSALGGRLELSNDSGARVRACVTLPVIEEAGA